jgi:hypothetical protein
MPGEDWRNVNAALREGYRTLPGGYSLADLLATARRARTRAAVPHLSIELILVWADAHHRRRGRWPRRDSGPIPEAPGETWSAVETALREGSRGLPAGSSLYALLKRQRCIAGRHSSLSKRKRGWPPDVKRRRQAQRLRAQGLTLSEIGVRMNCTKQNVFGLLNPGCWKKS